jgi:uncharacterized protein (DUF58 family)
MLGEKGRSLVIIGGFVLTAGFSFDNFYFITLAMFLIFATFISLPAFDSAMNIEELRVTRKLDSNKVFKDDFMHVRVIIENTGGNSFDFLDIFDEFPTDAFYIVAGENFISTRIDPHSKIVFSYVLSPRARGEFALGPIECTIRDRLGFNAEKRTVPNSITDIVIYPPYEDIKRLEMMGAKRAMNMSFGIHKTRQTGTGNEFRGLRQYVFGDQFRTIDWKASMRAQKLIVREFESEKNISTIILIDSSESMGGGAAENTKFEYSIKAAMLLAKIAMGQRDMVGLATFSDKKHFRWLRPSTKSTHFYDIVDFLGNVSPKGDKNIYWSMEEFTRTYHKRSLIFLISDLEVASKDILAAIRKLRTFGHIIILIAPFSPWFEIHELELTATDKALAEAISEEMMQHVVQVKKDAQKLATPVISVAPDDIFNVIMSEYEEAKRKGKGE